MEFSPLIIASTYNSCSNCGGYCSANCGPSDYNCASTCLAECSTSSGCTNACKQGACNLNGCGGGCYPSGCTGNCIGNSCASHCQASKCFSSICTGLATIVFYLNYILVSY